MKKIDKQIERVLTLLRNKIRERGFTQLQVQAQLGWGRSYISQLLTQQKALRMEQVLLILEVIGVSPREFFGELYGPLPAQAVGGGFQSDLQMAPGRAAGGVYQELQAFRSIFDGVVDLLLDKGLMSPEELRSAMEGPVEEVADETADDESEAS